MPVRRTKETAPDYERLADLAEAGLEPSLWKPRPGRPSISDARAGEHSPRMTTRVPADLRDAVLERAAAEGKTASEAMRDALELYVSRASASAKTSRTSSEKRTKVARSSEPAERSASRTDSSATRAPSSSG